MNNEEVVYSLAYTLVEWIDRNLQYGTCHFYNGREQLLRTLDEVIYAIFNEGLKIRKER